VNLPSSAEAASCAEADGVEEHEHLNLTTSVAPAVAVVSCAACDGSGLWRGIDGFVFVCQHCCFEMT
jgi:hypothetical protein